MTVLGAMLATVAVLSLLFWDGGSSGGLGRIVPELLEALGPYAGRNTGGTVEIVLD